MKNKNLSWVGALFVFALLLWCTAVTPGKVADPATYTCAVYSTFFSLLPPVIAIVLALNTKEVYTSLLVGIASGALLYANGNLELALNTLFFNEDGGMITKLSDSGNVGILAFLVMLGILVALMNKAGGSAAFGRWASTHIHSRAGAQSLQARRMRMRRPEGTLIAFCELVIKTLLDINRPLLSFLHSIERMSPVSVVCRRGCFFSV